MFLRDDSGITFNRMNIPFFFQRLVKILSTHLIYLKINVVYIFQSTDYPYGLI